MQLAVAYALTQAAPPLARTLATVDFTLKLVIDDAALSRWVFGADAVEMVDFLRRADFDEDGDCNHAARFNFDTAFPPGEVMRRVSCNAVESTTRAVVDATTAAGGREGSFAPQWARDPSRRLWRRRCAWNERQGNGDIAAGPLHVD